MMGDISEGDFVMIGRNHGPRYEVLAIRGDRVWIKHEGRGLEGLTSRDILRRAPR